MSQCLWLVVKPRPYVDDAEDIFHRMPRERQNGCNQLSPLKVLRRNVGISAIMYILTHLAKSYKMGKVIKVFEFDARMANRPFLVFDFRPLWRRVPESRKLQMVG